MRGGVLLAENSPGKLMAQESANSLEEAFLSLSRRQEKIDSKEGQVIMTILFDLIIYLESK